MQSKFVVLSNGLRDQCGHYYETSISVAEAARRNGFRPVLATHVDCPASLVPDWLETYPMFCTDHWMSGPPAEPPDLAQICANPYSRPRVAVGDVRDGRASVRDLLASRFGELLSADGLPCRSTKSGDGLGRPSSRSMHLAKNVFHRYLTSCQRIVRRLDRLAYYLLPPAFYVCLVKAASWSTPPILRPDVQAKIAAKLTERFRRPPAVSVASTIDYGPCGPETAKALENPCLGQRDVVGKALVKLRAANMAHEAEFAMLFKRDLERFLAVADIGAGDHVFLGTAHPRELLAIELICRQLGTDRSPTFHLEFRHPLPPASPYALLHDVFFSLYEESESLTIIRLYTDTEELARHYAPLASEPFEVLPIPFRQELIAASPGTAEPLNIAFLGEARDEKGFAWLPNLIEDLAADYVSTGKVRFLLQANLGDPRYNPQSAVALDRLKRLPNDTVQLFGLDGPLSPEAYYRLVSASHLVLVPYDCERYRASSSGTLTEAIAGGRPVVVPSGTWMAAQLPSAAGESYDDYPSFVSAVRRVIDDYPHYLARAAACRDGWLAKHSPDALVRALTNGAQQQRIAA